MAEVRNVKFIGSFVETTREKLRTKWFTNFNEKLCLRVFSIDLKLFFELNTSNSILKRTVLLDICLKFYAFQI